jgi:hypothetical protein
VPDLLSHVQKAQGINQARLLVRLLQAQYDQAWHDIVALDGESWFYPRTSHKFIWLPRGETVPERERRIIALENFIVTIV